MQTCKLCRQMKDICKSHAIPNSFFKKIFRPNNGQGILITEDIEDYTKTQDSWAVHQLCKDCEGLLNREYEAYSISLLRENEGMVVKTAEGVRFNQINANKLYMFFIAILWRAALSDHDYYSKVAFPYQFENKNIAEKMRLSILNNGPFPVNTVSLKISKIVDSNFGYTELALKDFITAPDFKIDGGKLCVYFAVEGHFIEIYMPGFSYKDRYRMNIIERTKGTVFFPNLEIKDNLFLFKVCGVQGKITNIF